MTVCSAFGCTSRPSKKIPGITFHSFPKDKQRKNEWIKLLRRKNWQPSRHSKLCSKHFPEDMMDRTSLSCVRLKTHAIPVIFEGFPSHLKKILEEKKKIESTYEDEDLNTHENGTNKNVSVIEEMSNGDENSEPYDDNSNQINEIKINKVFSINNCDNSPTKVGTIKPDIHKQHLPESILGTSKSEAVVLPTNVYTCSNSNFIKVQYVSPTLLNKLSSSLTKKTVNTCDASTTTERSGSVEYELRQQLANCDLVLNTYRKRIRTLQQQNRRYKDRLRNIKHSIFAELLKRQYLSSDSYFKTGQQDCLLDRQSIRPCISSESEKSDEDE